MEITGEVKEAPRSEWATSIARALLKARKGLNFALSWPGGGLGDFIVGKAPEGWEKIAYGDYPYTLGERGLGDVLPKLRRGRAGEVVDIISTLPIGTAADVATGGKAGATALYPAIAGAVRRKGDIVTPHVAIMVADQYVTAAENATNKEDEISELVRNKLAHYLHRRGGMQDPVMENTTVWEIGEEGKPEIAYGLGEAPAWFSIQRDLPPANVGTWQGVIDTMLVNNFKKGSSYQDHLRYTGDKAVTEEMKRLISEGSGIFRENLDKVLVRLPSENLIAVTTDDGYGRAIDATAELIGFLRGPDRPPGIEEMDFPQMVSEYHKFYLNALKNWMAMHKPDVTSRVPMKDLEWVELRPIHLAKEGDEMHHCVGSYCNDVESGIYRIFSLRTKDGKPKVTISALRDGGNWVIEQIKGRGNTVPLKYRDVILDFIEQQGFVVPEVPPRDLWLLENYKTDPDEYERWRERYVNDLAARRRN